MCVQARIAVVVEPIAMYGIVFVAEMRAVPNMTYAAFRKSLRDTRMNYQEASSFRTVSNKSRLVMCTILLQGCIGELRLRAWLGIVDNLPLDLFLVVLFVDR